MGKAYLQSRVMVYGNSLIAVLLAGYFFFLPGVLVLYRLSDPGFRTEAIPGEAWRLHRYLTPRYATWARERIASKKAAEVHYLNVPATEWPVFGSVFFLMATDNLQTAWEKDNSLSATAPAVYARETIDACKDVLLDPSHHTWVKTHWGENYMHRENVFFRSLLIVGLTSYERLTKKGDTLYVLRDQTETLAKDLDNSPHGVLHDYPHECYPIDVFAATAWIRRADAVLGTDHSKFIERQRRAFTGDRLDEDGLIPWDVHPVSGQIYRPSRGVVNSYVLIFAPEMYPDLAKTWYELTEKHFWDDKWYGDGFREFKRDAPYGDWTYDVDSGPIIAGFSPAASTFGVAATKVNGRLDHSYTLASQVMMATWPLPDGRLLGPRILSDRENAPYLGEVSLLWILTETPHEKATIVTGGHVGGGFYIGLVFYFGISLVIGLIVWRRLRRYRKKSKAFRQGTLQSITWFGFLVIAAAAASQSSWGWAFLVLCFAQFLPVNRIKVVEGGK